MTSNALNALGWIPLTSAAPIDWLDLVVWMTLVSHGIGD